MKKRIVSLLLCVAMLYSLLPFSAFAADSEQLKDVADIKNVLLYEGTSPTTGTKVEVEEGEYYLIKNTSQMLLYYEFDIREDAVLSADIPYYLPIPKGLEIRGEGGTESLKLTREDGVEETFATLNWNSSGAALTFTQAFVENKEQEATGTHCYFGCVFNKETATKVDGENNRYKIELTTSTTVTVGLDEDEIREQAAKLEKTVEKDPGDPNLLTWTITYTPYKNTEKTEFQIRDTLGEGMSPAFLNADGTIDSNEVTVKRGGTEISTAKVAYDSGTRTLTISDMGEDKTNWDQPITITYRTKMDTALSLPKPNSKDAVSQGGELTNQAALWGKEPADGELKLLDIKVTATHELAKTTYLSKKVEKVGADGRLLRWTVTVDRGVIPTGTTITLTDTLPDSLDLVTADSDPAKGPTLNGTSHTLTVDATTKSFSLTLNDDSFVNGKAILVYDTRVKEAFYEKGDDLGANTAKIHFEIEGLSYTPTVTVGVGKGAGVSTARLTKVNQGFGGKREGYLRSARSSQWRVTINPNKADLSYAELTDDFGSIGKNISCQDADAGHTRGSSLNWEAITGVWDGGIQVKFDGQYSGEVTIKKPDWTGNTCSIVADGTSNVQIGTGAPLLTLTENDGKLNFTVGNVGQTSISITYVTKLNDPCAFAGNIIQHQRVTNTVAGRMRLGSHELSDVGFYAVADISSKILEKGKPVYDYATGQIQWTVTVNESGMPLSNLVLTDTLADGLTYVENSLRVNGAVPAAAITAEQRGQLLTIRLGDISAKTTVSFRTSIDPNKLGFDKGNNVSLSNSIEMKGKAFEEEFKPVSSAVKQTISNHGLDKSGKLNKEDEQIAYTVTINPFHIPLSNASVTDTLPKGLRLDPDTVKLYQAALSGSTGKDGKGAPTATKGAEVTEGWSFTTNAADNSFTVKLPDGNDAYVLTYAADILDMTQNQNYSNKIVFSTSGGTATMGGEKQNSVTAGGGGGGVASQKKGSLTLTKQGENGTALSGVTFTLYLWDKDNNRRDMAFSQDVTDSDGKITFKALKLNKSYELVETTPAGYQAGYKLVGTMPAGVTKNADGNLVLTPTATAKQIALTLKNELITVKTAGKLTVIKQDRGNSQPLAGARFALYDNELCTGSHLATKITDATGQAVFENLEPDKPMWLKELSPPAGYRADGSVKKILIDASGPLNITETVENTALPSGGSGGIGGGSGGGTQSPNPNKPNPDAPAAPPSQEPPIQPDAPTQQPDSPVQPNVPAQPDAPAQPSDLNTDASNRTDRRDPSADRENSKTEAAKLPQTGQLWWPVWLLTAVGILILIGGLTTRKRYVGKHEK